MVKNVKMYVTYILLFILGYILSKEIKEGLINFPLGGYLPPLPPLPEGQLKRKNIDENNIPIFYR